MGVERRSSGLRGLAFAVIFALVAAFRGAI
jgi:hypothetical protein